MLLVTLALMTSGCQTRVVEKEVEVTRIVTRTPSTAGISTWAEPADPIIRDEEPSEEDCAYEIGEEDTCYDLYGFWGIPPYAPGVCVDWQEIMRLENRNVECVRGVVKVVECAKMGEITGCVARFTDRKTDYNINQTTTRHNPDQFIAAWESVRGSCIQATGYNAARDGNSWMMVHDLDDVVACDY